MGTAPVVFISYSHEDEVWKERLLKQLKVLEFGRYFTAWDDRQIGGGTEWKRAIEEALASASVSVLLISASFLTSRFILDTEVPRLLQRRLAEGVSVVPVIIRPCLWQEVPWLARIQARPRDGRPLSGGSDHQIETDLTEIAREVLALLRTSPRTRAASSPLGSASAEATKVTHPIAKMEVAGLEGDALAQIRAFNAFVDEVAGKSSSDRRAGIREVLLDWHDGPSLKEALGAETVDAGAGLATGAAGKALAEPALDLETPWSALLNADQQKRLSHLRSAHPGLADALDSVRASREQYRNAADGSFREMMSILDSGTPIESVLMLFIAKMCEQQEAKLRLKLKEAAAVEILEPLNLGYARRGIQQRQINPGWVGLRFGTRTMAHKDLHIAQEQWSTSMQALSFVMREVQDKILAPIRQIRST